MWTPPVGLRQARYLSLCDDVEGAALLALPDDILSFIIVFLMGWVEKEGGEKGGGGWGGLEEDNSQN